MRYEAAVTSISWIPSEAVPGMTKAAFESGVTHYDDPPPDTVDDLVAMRDNDKFRFANDLRAWIEVYEGRITKYGYSGGGLISSTRVKVGPTRHTFQPGPLPDIQARPAVNPTSVTFVQTTGGRSGAPAPRRVRHKPYIQFSAPLVWTTLELTIFSDGSSKGKLTGASKFPRHWVYDGSGKLTAKVGMADFKDWYRRAFGKHTPWGDEDSPALVTAAETGLERQLSTTIMRGGAKPKVRKIKEGKALVEQGTEGDEVYLVLDGVIRAEVDGEPVAEYGPGSIHGERAILEGGIRTSTLRALTPVKVAVATGDQIDKAALRELSEGHRKEEKKG